MKKAVLAILIISMSISLCACGSSVQKNSVFSAADVTGKKVGVMSMSAAESYVGQAGNAEASAYDDSAEMMSDLKSGSLDCVIADASMSEELLSQAHGVKVLDEAYVSEPYSIITAKENADLIEAVNGALTALQENGTLDSIIGGYIMNTGYKYVPDDTTAKKGTVTLAVSADFPPYSYSEGGQVTGLDVDVAMAVCDKLGVELSVVTVSTQSEMVEMVKEGGVTMAMCNFVAGSDILKDVDATNSYFTSDQVIIVRKR